jgi:hypothetical protein
MELAIARRSWQDGVLAFFALLLIYLSCELSRTPKKSILYIPFVLIGSYCILIKESGVIVYGLCMAWVLAVLLWRERAVAKAIVLMLLGGMGFFAAGFILVAVVGGPGVALEVLRHVKDAMPTNAYAIDYQTGPWYRIPEGLWILTPACFILCIFGIGANLIRFRDNASAIADGYARTVISGMIFFTCLFIFITMLTPYCQNIRYISAVYGPFYLIAAMGMWALINFLRVKLRGVTLNAAMFIAAVVMVVIAVNAYGTFDRIFLKYGIRDISVRLLREAVYQGKL